MQHAETLPCDWLLHDHANLASSDEAAHCREASSCAAQISERLSRPTRFVTRLAQLIKLHHLARIVRQARAHYPTRGDATAGGKRALRSRHSDQPQGRPAEIDSTA